MLTNITLFWFLANVLFPTSSYNNSNITRKYKVEISGIDVGHIIATKKTLPNGQKSYAVLSDVKVNFVVYKLHLNYDVKSTFDQNGLVSSKVLVKSNTNNYYTHTNKIPNGYSIDSFRDDTKEKKQLDQTIQHSSSSLYFEEPTQKTAKVYAEYLADFISLSKLKEGEYKGILDKNEEKYYYKEGILVKMTKKSNMKSYTVTLIQ